MADDALLRELQRRAAGTGSVEDRAALLRELMRLGRVVKGWFLVPEGEFARRYGLGLAALRAEAKVEALVGLHPSVKEDARPLTFRETLEARRDQFVANKGRTPNDLFSSYLDTCTAIAYKADSTKFKLIFQSDALLSIGVDFNRAIISDFDYEAIRVGPGVVELDVTDGVYNVPLSFADVLKHPGWLAVVEGDRVLLKSYAKIVFDLVGSSAMAFWVVHRRDSDGRWVCPRENQLRALCVVNLVGGNSDCIGYRGLNCNARFARVSTMNREPR